jgi:uncharacterized coiled-coil DUF342 family protein
VTDSEITTTILRQIRDELIATRTELKAEIAKTNERLDQANERLDQTNERLDTTNERLGAVETVVLDLVAHVKIRSSVVQAAQGSAIEDLRERVAKLEAKVG